MPTSACPFRSHPAAVADRRARMGRAIGRLEPGVTLDQVQANLAQAATALEHDHPADYAVDGGRYTATASSLDDEMRRELRPTLLLLLVTAGLVLSIACVSVSNLTLARLTYRADELSLRAALGATRPRIVRQLLTENLFAAAAGTLAGLLLAQISLDRLTDYVQRGDQRPGRSRTERGRAAVRRRRFGTAPGGVGRRAAAARPRQPGRRVAAASCAPACAAASWSDRWRSRSCCRSPRSSRCGACSTCRRSIPDSRPPVSRRCESI